MVSVKNICYIVTPVYSVCIMLLFNMMSIHCVVLDAFRTGVMVPIHY